MPANSSFTRYAFGAGAVYFLCMAVAHYFGIKVPVAIIVLAITVLGLISVNTSNALSSVLEEGQSTMPYWLQTGFIGLYVIVLVTAYRKDGRRI
jgi:hypothetical protein